MDAVRTKSPAELLATPVQFLKGVGPERAELIEKLGLRAARDLLFFFPRDYQDMSEIRPVAQLEDGQLVTVRGVVEDIELRQTGIGRSIFGVLIRDQNMHLRGVWFNQPFMRDKFRFGQHVLFSGEPKLKTMRWEMSHPKVEWLSDANDVPTGKIMPVYGLTEGLNQAQMRRIVHAAVESCAQHLDEVLPDEFLDEHGLWPIRAALPQLHAPSDPASLEQARRRFVFQELLVLQLALALRKARRCQQLAAPRLEATAKIDARIRRLFPFRPTEEQEQAIREISADMNRPIPMNRLLQGDVGSGKTAVAEYAMLLAVAHGHQAAMMAPTEVLARQHERTLTHDLREGRVRIGLLTGSLGAAERRDMLQRIASGDVDLIVGTHAIVQEAVQFARLGLVVIDEQHRFGVRQRATLKSAGLAPHYLVMTATPIPRTVSMTLFGDLDVSTLRSPPPGRQPVHTYLGTAEQRERWWTFVRKKIEDGRQAYVIVPRVELSRSEAARFEAAEIEEFQRDESDVTEAASVQRTLDRLAAGPLAGIRLGAIHGRLGPREKEAAMENFEQGRTQVLVATSVVEVGINVPNATVMTIENGERFGLAQLHQLRGRIRRGTHPGYVCVFAESPSDEARQRLDALARTSDGFELAELDFQLRGPGDLFGTRQHGLPPLRIADLSRDSQVLEEARHAAQKLVGADPDLAQPAYSRLRHMVLRRYGQALDLGDVG